MDGSQGHATNGGLNIKFNFKITGVRDDLDHTFLLRRLPTGIDDLVGEQKLTGAVRRSAVTKTAICLQQQYTCLRLGKVYDLQGKALVISKYIALVGTAGKDGYHIPDGSYAGGGIFNLQFKFNNTVRSMLQSINPDMPVAWKYIELITQMNGAWLAYNAVFTIRTGSDDGKWRTVRTIDV